MQSSEVQTVLAWHAALNAGDIERLVGLSSTDIEVGGPRGAGSGTDLLRDWVARARIQLEPLRWRAQGAVVVVEQNARWQVQDGQLSEPQVAGSVLRVKDGRVISVLRFSDFAAALEFAGLAPSPAA